MKRSMIAAISVMLLTAAAAVAEVSGEHPVSSPAYGPPPGYRDGAASASDGHDFLVVWRDTERIVDLFNMRVYATRVNASGQVLDPLGIRIPTLTANPTQFNVVYLGGSYLVCWNEGDGSDTATPPPPLVGVRISDDGQLLDSAPRVFADHGRLSQRAIASNGARAVIAYTATNGNLTTLVFDRDANIVDGPRTLNTSSIASNETALTSSNGRGFLVVQTFGNANFETANATTLDASGIPLSSEQVVTAAQPGDVFGLASDGDSYVAIFEGTAQISAQHFGPGGEILETALFPLLQVFPGLAYPRQQVLPGLIFTGGSYLFMDADPVQQTLFIGRLSRTGQPVGGYSPIASASNAFYAVSWSNTTLASNGSSAFAGWGRGTFNGSMIEVSSLAAPTPFVIARAATTQVTPEAASSGTNTAIVWNEADGVYAGRLTLDGQSLDGRGIRIGGPNLTEPRIAFDGANYIIGWVEQDPTDQNSTLKVARFAPGSGALLDPTGIAITQKSYGGLALSPGANGTLLAWSEGNNVVASILGRDLSHGLPAIVNPAETIGAGPVSAAWNGSEWLLTWQKPLLPSGGPQCDPTPCYEFVIFAARLSSQLALLDPTPIVVDDTLADDGRPVVASDGDGFLVTWSRSDFYDYYGGEGGYDYSVAAQRISRDGSILGPVSGVLLGSGQVRSIVWDGLQYDVAFSARRYPPYSVALFVPSTATLNVTHVAAHGAIESLTPLAVVSDGSDHDASLIVTGMGSVAVAYTRIGVEPEYGDVERVFVSIPHALRARAAGSR